LKKEGRREGQGILLRLREVRELGRGRRGGKLLLGEEGRGTREGQGILLRLREVRELGRGRRGGKLVLGRRDEGRGAYF
jgi:hypothetical protein